MHGLYPEAYILAQSKGLSQIKNDRAIRNEYQLTIAFNYAETEDIKRFKFYFRFVSLRAMVFDMDIVAMFYALFNMNFITRMRPVFLFYLQFL